MNDNIHESDAQEIIYRTNIDKYKVHAYIYTDYYILLKSIFLRIIIPKFMMVKQLFHVKDVYKKVINQHV